MKNNNFFIIIIILLNIVFYFFTNFLKLNFYISNTIFWLFVLLFSFFKNKKSIFPFLILLTVDAIIYYFFHDVHNYNAILIKIINCFLLYVVYTYITKFSLIKMFKESKTNTLFFIAFMSMSIFVLFTLMFNHQTINEIENRSSYRFSFPKLKELLNGNYQDNFEKSCVDQFPGNENIKKAYNDVTSQIKIRVLSNLNTSKYIKLNDDISFYNGYLVYRFVPEDEFIGYTKDFADRLNERMEKSKKVNFYLYFLATDNNYKYDEDLSYDINKILEENIAIPKKRLKVFTVPSFDVYKKYFYKADHHWNYMGSYKGYKEIAELMNYKRIINYNNKECIDNIYLSGSKARKVGMDSLIYDETCFYKFNYPDMEFYKGTTILSNYGAPYNKITDGLKKDDKTTYGRVYGEDIPELIIKNKGENNNKKLLVYSNSFSNAVNKLIASEYKTTYIIDGRYLKDFNLSKYIEQNDIDDVLILANVMLFWDDIDL